MVPWRVRSGSLLRITRITRVTLIALIALTACGRVGFDARTVDADQAAARDAASHPDAAPVAFVESMDSQVQTGAVTTVSLPVAAGDLLVASTAWYANEDPPALVDSLGSVWQGGAVVSACDSATAGGGTNAALWIAEAPATGTDTITLTQTVVGEDIALFVARYAWGGGGFVIDASADTVAPAASATMTTSITTTRASLVVALFQDSIGEGTMVADAGWQTRQTDVVANMMQVDDAPSAPAGTYAIGGTLQSGTSDACWIVDAYAIARP